MLTFADGFLSVYRRGVWIEKGVLSCTSSSLLFFYFPIQKKKTSISFSFLLL